MSAQGFVSQEFLLRSGVVLVAILKSWVRALIDCVHPRGWVELLRALNKKRLDLGEMVCQRYNNACHGVLLLNLLEKRLAYGVVRIQMCDLVLLAELAHDLPGDVGCVEICQGNTHP